MRPRARRAYLLGVAILAGCYVGQSVQEFEPVRSGHGVTAAFTTVTSRSLEGELLTANETGVLLLVEGAVREAAWSDFEEFRVAVPHRLRVYNGEPPTAEALGRMQAAARFPFGLSDAHRQEFLEVWGQANVIPIIPDSTGNGQTIDSFLTAARSAALRFPGPTDAIRAGYRKLGPDFPSMGEHWIHPGKVMAGSVDPNDPPVLSYATIDGQKTLVGMAFTAPLAADQAPPPHPFPKDVWHDHTNSVDEEAILLNHPSSLHGSADSYRIAMVHVWIPLENPDGVLAQHNWNLPFLRAGLDPWPDASDSARRGLSLAGAGRGYYQELVRRATALGNEDLARSDLVIAEYADVANRWIAAQKETGAPIGSDGLETIWLAFVTDLRDSLPEPAWQDIAFLATANDR